LEPDELPNLAVDSAKNQPDINQAHRGTVIHRRWEGDRAAALAADQTLQLMVQREPDDLDDSIPYAVVLTIEMPGVNEIYNEVRARVAVQPPVPVAV
jgi:hypothetical protein